MEPDRTCKRCSVIRVNALVKVYDQAHAQGDRIALSRLKELAALVGGRGFADARGLLTPGLLEKDLRALCWNVSSFLEDGEVGRILGLKL
ncbi:MAG: hypothetical protein AB1814_06525 [Thermodesulfobacteriota bacterium]